MTSEELYNCMIHEELYHLYDNGRFVSFVCVVKV